MSKCKNQSSACCLSPFLCITVMHICNQRDVFKSSSQCCPITRSCFGPNAAEWFLNTDLKQQRWELSKWFKSTNRWRMVMAALFVFHFTFTMIWFLQGFGFYILFECIWWRVSLVNYTYSGAFFLFLDERIASQSHQNWDSESAALDAEDANSKGGWG